MVMCSLIQAVINLDVATYCKLASYTQPFQPPRFYRFFILQAIVVVGKAGYKATVSNDMVYFISS